jgi:ABC-2 type transport system ATP-binding protein
VKTHDGRGGERERGGAVEPNRGYFHGPTITAPLRARIVPGYDPQACTVARRGGGVPPVILAAMDAVIQTQGLGKRYRGRQALTECTLTVPAGTVTGLVGPNGAGKSTLLNLIIGMLPPTEGAIRVLNEAPGAQLAKVGFVAQETPTYAGLSIADHLKLGAHLNPGWDQAYARARIERLGLDLRQKAGKLSGGQRAQLALTMAIAKRPELLILDEPVAALDPLARRGFMDDLTGAARDTGMSVVLSSHLVSDLDRVCDWLIVLNGGRVRAAGPLRGLLAAHPGLTTEDMVLTYLEAAS